MKKNVFSFDVFDTCLCRLCGEPRLLFEVLSLQVQKAMGSSGEEYLRQAFVVARVEAGGKNLEEIYHQVARRFPLPFSEEQMVELELETERKMLVPILATRDRIAQLRARGDILFISDMYLPSDFIRERLVEFGFFQAGDKLYVSDELDAWKHDGSLYRLVHEKDKIPYNCWYHFGDNRHSDYLIPRKLGIHARVLRYDYLPYEETWRSIPVLQFQYSAILAGVARAIRLSTNARDDQKAFVCDVTTPLVISWLLCVLEDASQRGILRLYFCARDVHTQYLLARRLQPLFPNLQMRYLFISRQAIESDEDRLCEYLSQEGVLSTEVVALVDSCSTGFTRACINAIGARNNLLPVGGYLLVSFSSKLFHPINIAFPWVYYLNHSSYSDVVASSVVRKMSGMRILFELVLSLNFHKKTIGYEKHGLQMRPVFGQDTVDDWYVAETNARHSKRDNDHLVTAFADAFVSTGLWAVPKDILSQVAIPTFVEFVDRPNKTYLHYLHRFIWWGHPFVGSLLGKNRGVWHRGNLFYRLPIVLTVPLRFILSNTVTRRQLNRFLSWLKRQS